MTVETVVTPEPDDAPEVVDSGDTIVVTDAGGDDETARTVGRLEAENEQMRRELDELRASVAVAEVVAENAEDTAEAAVGAAVAAVEVAAEAEAEAEAEPEPEPEDDPPSGKHPFHKSWGELRHGS